MAHRVCPPWMGYLLANPLRKIFENPHKILSGFVKEGMSVLEPGCGMGFFTLPLAKLVGTSGRVIAVDLQPEMLSALARRAKKAGFSETIIPRKAEPETLGIKDLSGEIDFAVAIHVVHETSSQKNFFSEIRTALRRGAKLFVMEPRWHVREQEFKETISIAEAVGLGVEKGSLDLKGRKLLLSKQT